MYRTELEEKINALN